MDALSTIVCQQVLNPSKFVLLCAEGIFTLYFLVRCFSFCSSPTTVHVFKSLRLDFWDLALAPKPLCKVRRSAVECLHCSSSTTTDVWKGVNITATQTYYKTQRQSRDCPTDHTRCQTEETRDSNTHSTKAVGQTAKKRVTPKSDDEQESNQTTVQYSSPFSQSTVIH